MRSLKYFVLASLAVAAVAGLGVYRAADDKPLDIETIMEKAHKAPKGKVSLFKTVVGGKAEKDQKEELLKLYADLGKNKPPKGSEDDWKKRCEVIVVAAKDVVADKPNSLLALKNAVKCAECHEAHKAD
jgi:hypothetical protein